LSLQSVDKLFLDFLRCWVVAVIALQIVKTLDLIVLLEVRVNDNAVSDYPKVPIKTINGGDAGSGRWVVGVVVQALLKLLTALTRAGVVGLNLGSVLLGVSVHR
jgi:hypothetical protein